MLKLLNILRFLKVFKNTEFKILTINLGVVATIRAVGVRGDPCGAMQRIASQGSPRTPTACIPATTPRLIVRILYSVFLKTFNNF